jgi:hypothetical protein
VEVEKGVVETGKDTNGEMTRKKESVREGVNIEEKDTDEEKKGNDVVGGDELGEEGELEKTKRRREKEEEKEKETEIEKRKQTGKPSKNYKNAGRKGGSGSSWNGKGGKKKLQQGKAKKGEEQSEYKGGKHETKTGKKEKCQGKERK